MFESDVLVIGRGVLTLSDAEDVFEDEAMQEVDVAAEPDAAELVLGVGK